MALETELSNQGIHEFVVVSLSLSIYHSHPL
jgi:hypothetical protein